MSRWLPQFRWSKRSERDRATRSPGTNREGRSLGAAPPASQVELLVLEGDDAGRKFTVDGDQVRIGRGEPQAGRPGAILLTDPSVAVEQALIQVTPSGAILIDRADPGPATLLNDGPMVSRPLRVADQIRMGRVLLEVREHRGMSVTTLFGNTQGNRVREATTAPIDAERTEVRSKEDLSSHLLLTSGIEGMKQKRFELKGARNILGRSAKCDIHLPERGVSRQHAEILLENGKLVLRHLSQVNPTFVNGAPVNSRRELRGGDEIQLADQVVLKLVQFGDTGLPLADRGLSLQEHMEDKIERDRAIEEQFAVSGSFLDVDVVDSYGLKAEGGSAELKIVSFERFRAFVANAVEDHRGQVLNSNGDELMCFFEEPAHAVGAATALLDKLPQFNEHENMLSMPFRIRCGIHTGNSLVDRDRGVAYSPVLDLSGHLQKNADIDGLLISESTLEAISDDPRFEESTKLEKSGLRTFRLIRD